ncbi:hypothetical protein [Streptomyces sp. YIM S03343]
MSDRAATALREAWRLPAADASRGYEALWWSAGPAGELAVMLVHRRYLERSPYVKGWVGWWPKGPFTGELVTVTGQGERRTLVEDIRILPSHLAVLPDSRFLLAGSRTRRAGTERDWEPNAVAFSASGTPEGEFCIGDDIPALVTDRRGGIWTAYGDEGIYGDHRSPRPAWRAGTPKAVRHGTLTAACPTTRWRVVRRRPRMTRCGWSGTPAPGPALS